MMFNSLVISILFILITITISFKYNQLKYNHYNKQYNTKTQLYSNEIELDVGDFNDVTLKKINSITTTLGKYKLEATIKSKEFNNYLNDYKEEMKRRKVSFPGFRPGKLPPYVMGDVRKYLISFGLETLIGQLCNINGLELTTEEGEDVNFGEDQYYEEIIQKDFRGYNFTEQRDSWREGTDYSFVAEFFALREEEEDSDSEVDSSTNVVDTELVQG
mmetsp:Transcript_24783/g.22513  ORF Transcript_24783/g.22513 Transcript_24783/m.22513 type:complete len:217 (+) Transcript_24783:9-659(+)